MITVLGKIWPWVKAYWYIPVGLLALGILAIFVGQPAVSKMGDLMRKAARDHEDELAAIEVEREKEKLARETAEREMESTLRLIEYQHKEAKVALDEKKRAKVKKIIAETQENPEELARRLSELTGFKIILPEES